MFGKTVEKAGFARRCCAAWVDIQNNSSSHTKDIGVTGSVLSTFGKLDRTATHT